MATNMDMPGEKHRIRDNIVIADYHIVRDVRGTHEKIMFTENGIASLQGASMDGDLLADGVVVTKNDAALFFRIKGEVLW